MALPVTLRIYYPWIVVSLATEQVGITIIGDPEKFQVGLVEQVYVEGTIKTAAGDYVLFNLTKATRFTISSTNYFIVDENDLFFKETPAP